MGSNLGDKAIDDFFAQVESTDVGGFAMESAASQLAKMVANVGPVDVTTAEGLLVIKPLKDPGYLFRAVVAVGSASELEVAEATAGDLDEAEVA